MNDRLDSGRPREPGVLNSSEPPLYRLRVRTVTLSCAAFASLLYFDLLADIVRVGHDTYWRVYPWRVYLSDSLASGVFPFWDPFGSPGITTADPLGGGVYYPLAFALGLLTRYFPSTLVLEIWLTALGCMAGTYAWLRARGALPPLALAGALAYAGSAPLMSNLGVFSAVIAMSAVPWVFLGVYLVTSRGPTSIAGVPVLALAGWGLLTGGYAGVTYAIALYGATYALARVAAAKGGWRRAVTLLLAGGALAAALVALPVSEMIPVYVEQAREVRSFDSAADSFTGHLSPAAPLGMLVASPAYALTAGVFTGWGHLYASAVLLFAIPACGLVVGLRWNEVGLGVLAMAIMGAAMGPESPLATLFVNHVPGFALFRWHAWHGTVAAFLLVSVSIALLTRLQLAAIARPALSRRFAVALVLSFVAGAVPVLWYASTLPFFNIHVDYSDSFGFVESAVAVLLFVPVFVWWMREVHAGHAITEQHLVRVALAAAVLMAAGVVVLRMWSPQSTLVSLVPRWVLAFDLGRAGVFFGSAAALAWIASRRRIDVLAWSLLLVVVADVASAAPVYTRRYFTLTDGQVADERGRRTAAVEYHSNDRMVDLSSLVSESVEQLPYLALFYRIPTVLGTYPTFDRRTQELRALPGGERAFRKLVWWAPESGGAVVPLEELVEPEIHRLRLRPNSLDVDLTSPPGRLIWTDSWAAGWRAAVNGKVVDVARVYDALKAVDLPGGRAQVSFEYQPQYYALGLTAFGIGVMGCVAAGVIALRRLGGLPVTFRRSFPWPKDPVRATDANS